MKIKAERPLSWFNGRSLSPLLEAYLELNHLKQLYRQGWLRRGVPLDRCESVAEHVFNMAMLAWWIADAYFPNLDVNRVLRMVLVHELGEIYAGDITPGDHMSAEEKHRLEREGFMRVVNKLPEGETYLSLWEEFEEGATSEARLVRQIDRLEMGFQALIYEKQGFGNMDEFFRSVDAALTDPELRDILSNLEAERG